MAILGAQLCDDVGDDFPFGNEDGDGFFFPEVLVIPGVIGELYVIVNLVDSINFFLVFLEVDALKGLLKPALPTYHIFGQDEQVVYLEEGLDEDVFG